MNEFNDNFVVVKGVIARKNFDHFIFDEDEISTFTSFEKLSLTQKQVVEFEHDFDTFLTSAS